MKQELLMAVDLGTSLVKTGVYDLSGACLAVVREAVKSEQPAPGQFIQRGEDIFASVLHCLRQATERMGDRAKEIAAISFTGQMAGFMGVGDGWEDVTGWSCSIDTRYIPHAQAQMRRHADDFLNISGTNSPLFSAKYAWFREAFPERAKRIRKYLMLSGYIVGRLGDMSLEEAVIDGSLLTWTGLADVKERAWSTKICGALDIPGECLPRIVASYDVVARLSKEAARLTGLKPGIPLVAGAGDKIAGCVGAGNLRHGDTLFEAASFGAVSCMVGDFRPDREKRHYDILNGAGERDLYAHYYMPGSGITQEWYVNQFFRRLDETLAEAYGRMDGALSDIAPGSDGLVAIGMLGGTVMPFDGDLRGVFLGHSWTHRPEHFYRALVESFAYALSTAVDRMDALYPEHRHRERIRVIGSGAHAPGSIQIYADVLGTPLETINLDDAALWGASILAARGVGLVDDVAVFADRHIAPRRRFVPDARRTAVYAELKAQYNRYTAALSPLCRDRLHNG